MEKQEKKVRVSFVLEVFAVDTSNLDLGILKAEIDRRIGDWEYIEETDEADQAVTIQTLSPFEEITIEFIKDKNTKSVLDD